MFVTLWSGRCPISTPVSECSERVWMHADPGQKMSGTEKQVSCSCSCSPVCPVKHFAIQRPSDRLQACSHYCWASLHGKSGVMRLRYGVSNAQILLVGISCSIVRATFRDSSMLWNYLSTEASIPPLSPLHVRLEMCTTIGGFVTRECAMSRAYLVDSCSSGGARAEMPVLRAQWCVLRGYTALVWSLPPQMHI